LTYIEEQQGFNSGLGWSNWNV